MPRRDGTGPMRGGRGLGSGQGAGRMGGNRQGAGPSGECACPSCGAHLPHQVGTPCYIMNCPKCGAKMVRS